MSVHFVVHTLQCRQPPWLPGHARHGMLAVHGKLRIFHDSLAVLSHQRSERGAWIATATAVPWSTRIVACSFIKDEDR